MSKIKEIIALNIKRSKGNFIRNTILLALVLALVVAISCAFFSFNSVMKKTNDMYLSERKVSTLIDQKFLNNTELQDKLLSIDGVDEMHFFASQIFMGKLPDVYFDGEKALITGSFEVQYADGFSKNDIGEFSARSDEALFKYGGVAIAGQVACSEGFLKALGMSQDQISSATGNS